MCEEMMKEVAKEVAKEVYTDAAKPAIRSTGEIVGLLPRAIHAALLPVEKWILSKEYNLEATKKIMEKKLESIPAELIQSPELYIAAPAIQYISYCIDAEELREMYANLLANSMNANKSKDVHPAFVEIIKQLCPDEAKVLKYVYIHEEIPTVSLRFQREDGAGEYQIRHFSNIGEMTGCSFPLDITKYFNNLERLGLINYSPLLSSLVGDNLYQPLKEHPHITHYEIPDSSEYTEKSIEEGYVYISDFGKAFCSICIIDTEEKAIDI